MRRNRVWPGDDAVSPVVGSVLLVGIAVILMTSIGVFVLGVGPGEQPPRGEMLFSQSENEGPTGDYYNVTVTVSWAEDLFEGDVSILVGDERACTEDDPAWDGSGALSAGDTVTIDRYGAGCPDQWIADGTTVRVVWSSQGGAQTEVLAQYEVFDSS